MEIVGLKLEVNDFRRLFFLYGATKQKHVLGLLWSTLASQEDAVLLAHGASISVSKFSLNGCSSFSILDRTTAAVL